MFIKKSIIALMAVFITAISVYADEIKVYPVKGIFPAFNINSEIKNMLFRNKDVMNSEYLSNFNKYFTNAVQTVDDASKYNTFAAYIGIPRASKYEALRFHNKYLDVYYPMTLSINFVNMLSGETLYTTHLTTQNAVLVFDADTPMAFKNNELTKAYKETYIKHTDKILEEASKNFKPVSITTNVIGKYKDAYILDKGLGAGIVKDNILVNSKNSRIKVKYSSLNYSVAKLMFGSAETGEEFIKYSNAGSVTQIEKPKILCFNDFGDDTMYSLFLTEFGDNANFTIISMDDSYNLMKRELSKTTKNQKFIDDILEKRTMPNYLLKLHISKKAYAKYKTEHDYIDNDKYGIIACGTIFDKSGKVVYSNCSEDNSMESIKVGYRLDKDSHFEITTKNALLKLAEKIRNEIKFKEVEFKIDKIENDTVILKDKDNVLKKGNVLTIYKKVKINNSDKDVLIPIWDYKVGAIEKGLAGCVKQHPRPYFPEINSNPTKDDIVKISIASAKNNKSTLYNYNPDVVEMDGNEIALDKLDFENVAFAALTSTMKSDISIPRQKYFGRKYFDEEFLRNMEDKNFEYNIELPDNNTDLTIKPMYKISLKSEKYNLGGRIINREYNVEISVISKKGNEIIKQINTKKTVLISLPRKNNNDILQYELLKAIYPLIQQVASKF